MTNHFWKMRKSLAFSNSSFGFHGNSPEVPSSSRQSTKRRDHGSVPSSSPSTFQASFRAALTTGPSLCPGKNSYFFSKSVSRGGGDLRVNVETKQWVATRGFGFRFSQRGCIVRGKQGLLNLCFVLVGDVCLLHPPEHPKVMKLISVNHFFLLFLSVDDPPIKKKYTKDTTTLSS